MTTEPGPKARPPASAPVEGGLTEWERLALDAVGHVIEFWGFKRNEGRLWALLYLRATALTAAELERVLELSKGAVSMLLRELEGWGVVRKRSSEVKGEPARYVAEVELFRMVTKVLADREARFLSEIRERLAEACRLAEADPETSRQARERLRRLSALASHTERALKAFLRTARIDLGGLFAALPAIGDAARNEAAR